MSKGKIRVKRGPLKGRSIGIQAARRPTGEVCMGPKAVDRFLDLISKAEDKGMLSLEETEYLREALDEPIQ
jgi:hypothetical protein